MTSWPGQQQSKSATTLYFSLGPLWWKITSDFKETSDFVDRRFIFVEIFTQVTGDNH